jgi:hypothetical protein
MKKKKPGFRNGHQTSEMYDISNGIIAHLTRECGGNMSDHNVFDVASGSFEQLN